MRGQGVGRERIVLLSSCYRWKEDKGRVFKEGVYRVWISNRMDKMIEFTVLPTKLVPNSPYLILLRKKSPEIMSHRYFPSLHRIDLLLMQTSQFMWKRQKVLSLPLLLWSTLYQKTYKACAIIKNVDGQVFSETYGKGLPQVKNQRQQYKSPFPI